LKQSDKDLYGEEAIDTLLRRMEDDRGKFVVIASGSTKEMTEFFQSTLGLKSRFTDYFTFDD
jgi:phosphoserine phosphatase